MLSRLAGRMLTGPLAFLAAGLTDLAAFWLHTARAALRRRRGDP